MWILVSPRKIIYLLCFISLAIYKKSAVFYIFSPDAPEVEILNTSDDPILIFSEENLKQLQRRTEELKTERAMQKNKFK